LFDVRRDPRHPFVVCTPHGDVRVLGTSFVVRVRESSASATVFRGVVRGETPALRDRAGVHARVRLVATARANQEITMGGSQLVLTAAPPNIVARRLAWRRGVLDVYNEPLGDAAAEVTRHSGVEFEFADPAFARKGIVAHRPAGDADGFAAHVEEALGLQAERVAPDRIRFSEDPRRER
jgi:ferric-dicitrate binding protein FerR (iron transport regulator)